MVVCTNVNISIRDGNNKLYKTSRERKGEKTEEQEVKKKFF